jgi:phenylacetic acid degradation operon negative regulatory protein
LAVGRRSPAGDRPRSETSGKALLLTVLGEFVLPSGGTVWTGTLVEIMATVGIAEKNARQAISRLADDGVIEPERVGRRVRWSLSAHGHRLLSQGSARIYGFMTEPGSWDGRWLIVLWSIPEEQRSERHQLRQQLAFAGFGFPGPGVAVSPHLEREVEALDVLRRLGVADGAMVFRGEAGALATDAQLVGRAWDMEGLAGQYGQFIERFSRPEPLDERHTVGALTQLVHAWRRFPFVDPELPVDLAPPAWPGGAAHELFSRRHAAWVDGARRWVRALDGTA